jgi:hypothetical protein
MSAVMLLRAATGPDVRLADPYLDTPIDTLFEVVNGIRVEKSISVWEQHLAGVLCSYLAH